MVADVEAATTNTQSVGQGWTLLVEEKPPESLLAFGSCHRNNLVTGVERSCASGDNYLVTPSYRTKYRVLRQADIGQGLPNNGRICRNTHFDDF